MMDQVTIKTVNRAFEAAKRQADVAFVARKEAEAAKRKLDETMREAAATAQRFGATDPSKIQAVVLAETKDARAEAEAAAFRADEEAQALRILHYELDRVKTIVDIMKLQPEG